MTPRLVATLVAACATGLPAAAGTLTVKGHEFLLDGKPFDLWGVRVASAAQTQELTDHLIAQLDEYKAYGVNAVTVFYQGGSAGYADPFAPDGKAIDPGHQKRMEQIVRACDERGMVVIVGVFYQRCGKPQLKDWDAGREAVRTVARTLKPYRNVILNIANEQSNRRYEGLPWARVRNVPDLIDLCRVAKAEDAARVVGAGGFDHPNNEAIGRSKDVDVLLFDTSGPQPSGRLAERFEKAGVTNKPMVNVETFGAWTNQYLPQGVFPDRVKQTYREEVEAAARHPGLYLVLHNTPWFQAFSPGEKSRYDLGGRGTKDDPGVRWYFEAVKAAASARPAAGSAPGRAAGPRGGLRGDGRVSGFRGRGVPAQPGLGTQHRAAGYTGRGWLRYVGPSSGEGTKDGHNTDRQDKYQGNPAGEHRGLRPPLKITAIATIRRPTDRPSRLSHLIGNRTNHPTPS